MSSPFDHFKRINLGYEEPDYENGPEFLGFISDLYYSNHKDTVFFAEASSMMNIPDRVKEQFWRGVTIKYNRPWRWPKNDRDERIENIMKWFDCSYEKACDTSDFLPNSTYSMLEKLHNDKKA